MQKSKKPMKPSPDLTPGELRSIRRFESGKGKYRHFKNAEEAIKWLDKKPKGKRILPKKKYSPPLSKEEIADMKKARKGKGKLFDTPEQLIEDLHKNVEGIKKSF